MHRKLTAPTIALLLVVSLFSGPVAAQSGDPVDEWMATVDDSQSDDPPDGVFERVASLAPDTAVRAFAVIDGQLARYFDNPLEEPRSNTQTAQEFERTIEENNETFERELTETVNLTNESDTHAVIISHEETDPVTVWLVADASNGSVSNMRVLSRDEFNATGRTTDEIWVVEGDAAQNLPSVTTSIADRLARNESVGPAYQGRLGGRYCSLDDPLSGDIANLENCEIRSTIWMDQEAVLQGGTEV